MKHYIAILLFAACVSQEKHIDISRPPETPTKLALAPKSPLPGGVLLQAVTSSEASYSVFTGPTVCAAEDGHLTPFLACWGKPPRVGQPWELIAWTRATPAPDTEMAWLMVGWRVLNPIINYSNAGMPGCYLLIYPESFVSIPVGMNDGLISRPASTPGRIALNWTPPMELMGRTVWFQLLVADPTANQAGLITGAAMRATIGL